MPQQTNTKTSTFRIVASRTASPSFATAKKNKNLNVSDCCVANCVAEFCRSKQTQKPQRFGLLRRELRRRVLPQQKKTKTSTFQIVASRTASPSFAAVCIFKPTLDMSHQPANRTSTITSQDVLKIEKFVNELVDSLWDGSDDYKRLKEKKLYVRGISPDPPQNTLLPDKF